MIILTPAQADQVRGLTKEGHALAPRPFVASGASNPSLNGNFGLPEAVINDPAHAVHSLFLKTLLTVPDSSIRPGTLTDPSNPGSSITGSDWMLNTPGLEVYSYNSDWPVAQAVQISGIASEPIFAPIEISGIAEEG